MVFPEHLTCPPNTTPDAHLQIQTCQRTAQFSSYRVPHERHERLTPISFSIRRDRVNGQDPPILDDGSNPKSEALDT